MTDKDKPNSGKLYSYLKDSANTQDGKYKDSRLEAISGLGKPESKKYSTQPSLDELLKRDTNASDGNKGDEFRPMGGHHKFVGSENALLKSSASSLLFKKGDKDSEQADKTKKKPERRY